MLMTPRRRVREALGLAETVNFLTLRLALRDRTAAHQLPGLMFRSYMASGGKAAWRATSIFDFLPELSDQPTRITMEHVQGGGINTAIDELAYMALITAALQPACVFEIGTFRGRTALNFALNSPSTCEVHTIDLPDGTEVDLGAADQRITSLRRVGDDYRGRPEEAKITQHFGDSTQFDFSPWHGRCDIVFVDGGHTYPLAHSDTLNAVRMVRPGGVIIWHDWANYGEYHEVMRAVLDVLPANQVLQLESSQLAAYRA